MEPKLLLSDIASINDCSIQYVHKLIKEHNLTTNKESNRIKEMQNILKQLGIKSRFKKNELKIFGSEKIVQNNKCIIVKDLGDHRICMSTFILANLTGSKTIINNQ